jgi:hypothetical protein
MRRFATFAGIWYRLISCIRWWDATKSLCALAVDAHFSTSIHFAQFIKLCSNPDITGLMGTVA